MQKTILADNLFVYHLTGQSNTNILTLVHNGKAILIDTGFPDQARELKTALEADGLEPEIILTSHYHPDHINGNYIFSKCKFMGSEHYKQNFELFEALNPDHDFCKPTILIKDGQAMTYGPFKLKFRNLPGHCRDLLAVTINEKWIHVADLLMFTNDGKHTLPYISYDGSIDEHLHSLEFLQSLSYDILIPSHGTILTDSTAIQKAIEIRQYYLKKLQILGQSAKVEDCLCVPEENYAHLNIHDTNLKNIFE